MATEATAYDLAGRPEGVTDSAGTISHSYDAAGRLQGVTTPGPRTLAYQYDANGNRSRLTYPDGLFVSYEYDELDRPRKVFENGTSLLAEYQYNDLSQRFQASYGNGTTTLYQREADGDLQFLTHQFSGPSVLFEYTHDAVHNLRTGGTDDAQFTYDLQASFQPVYVPNALNQYASVGGTPHTYDANGNLGSDGTNSYTHDAENRLVAASTPLHSAGYTYDPFGRRTSKTVDGTLTRFLHDGDRVIAEYDGAGTLVRRYVYGPGIDEPIRMTTASASYTYHFDGQGSVIALTDATGALAETYTYSPFGETAAASALGNPYRYTGRRYDAETGLYYYRKRYYSPALGRFLEVDPIGHAGGINLYSYVHNNPLRWVDPLGFGAESQGGTPLIGQPGFSLGDRVENLVLGNGQGIFGPEVAAAQDFAFGKIDDALGGVPSAILEPVGDFLGQFNTCPECIGGSPPIIGVPGGAIAGRITGFTRHGLNQVIGRDLGRGVSARAVLDAVRNPTKIVQQSGGRARFVGANATVVLNAEGRVITAFGQPRGP